MRSNLELRCGCSKRPLLGVCGHDTKTGEAFVHVKIFKQGRIFGETVSVGGMTHIRCRECGHWSVITIKRESVDFVPAPLPDSISI